MLLTGWKKDEFAEDASRLGGEGCQRTWEFDPGNRTKAKPGARGGVTDASTAVTMTSDLAAGDGRDSTFFMIGNGREATQ